MNAVEPGDVSPHNHKITSCELKQCIDKAAALIDGEVVFSEETRWDPYFQSDPSYHLAGVRESLRRAAAHLPRVDAIGGSAAGIAGTAAEAGAVAVTVTPGTARPCASVTRPEIVPDVVWANADAATMSASTMEKHIVPTTTTSGA